MLNFLNMSRLADFYNQLYQKTIGAFGAKPMLLVEELLTHAPEHGKVLDIGAGDGRNSIFLAQKGFRVTAVDISEVGLSRINEIAKKENLDVQTKILDIKNENVDVENFNIVLITYVLHHLPTTDATRLLTEWKLKAPPKTIHLITAFTKDGDFYKDPDAQNNFYPAAGELKSLYSDWNILAYREKVVETLAKNTDGTHQKNLTSFLIAQKPYLDIQ
jgi:tellurite methyltransferase